MIIYIQRSVKNRNIKTQDPAAKITGPSVAIYTYDKNKENPKGNPKGHKYIKPNLQKSPIRGVITVVLFNGDKSI